MTQDVAAVEGSLKDWVPNSLLGSLFDPVYGCSLPPDTQFRVKYMVDKMNKRSWENYHNPAPIIVHPAVYDRICQYWGIDPSDTEAM